MSKKVIGEKEPANVHSGTEKPDTRAVYAGRGSQTSSPKNNGQSGSTHPWQSI